MPKTEDPDHEEPKKDPTFDKHVRDWTLGDWGFAAFCVVFMIGAAIGMSQPDD